MRNRYLPWSVDHVFFVGSIYLIQNISFIHYWMILLWLLVFIPFHIGFKNKQFPYSCIVLCFYVFLCFMFFMFFIFPYVSNIILNFKLFWDRLFCRFFVFGGIFWFLSSIRFCLFRNKFKLVTRPLGIDRYHVISCPIQKSS